MQQALTFICGSELELPVGDHFKNNSNQLCEKRYGPFDVSPAAVHTFYNCRSFRVGPFVIIILHFYVHWGYTQNSEPNSCTLKSAVVSFEAIQILR